MGNKINPNSVRLGVNKTWTSVWYATKREFSKALSVDMKIKKAVKKALSPAGLDRLLVNRYSNHIDVEAFVARPGVAIGRGGSGIEDLEKELKKMVKMEVKVNIKEIKKPDLSARVIARTIADGIERRQPSKLLIAAAKEKAMLAGATGIKIIVGGRINNSSQARQQKDSSGPVPLQTLKANIDYAEEIAVSKEAGLYGVKVWVYMAKDKLDQNNK